MESLLAISSGLECVQRLHAFDPDMKIVVLTGFASIATAVEAVKVGTVSAAYRALGNYTAVRLYRWLGFKHKVMRQRKGGSYLLSLLYGHFGLVRLNRLRHDVPWTKA